jgi:hypothetical protein
MRYLNCSPDDTVQDIPIITDEILAALEQSAALNSIGSYPADIEPEERFEESRKERQENMQRDGSENAARENEPESEEHEEHGEHEVRKQKVVCMAGARKSAGAARISDSPVTDLVESLSPSNVTLFRPRFRSPS